MSQMGYTYTDILIIIVKGNEYALKILPLFHIKYIHCFRSEYTSFAFTPRSNRLLNNIPPVCYAESDIASVRPSTSLRYWMPLATDNVFEQTDPYSHRRWREGIRILNLYISIIIVVIIIIVITIIIITIRII